MKRPILAACLLLASMAVAAAVVTTSWTNATKNTDDTDIPATGPASLVSTTVEWSACGAGDTFTTRAGAITAPAAQTTAPTPNLAPGRWCFRAFHTNAAGVSSDPTSVLVSDVPAPKPKPPTNFSIG